MIGLKRKQKMSIQAGLMQVCLVVVALIALVGVSYAGTTALPDPIDAVGLSDEGGPTGFRFARLTPSEVKVLRRRVKLPLDAIFAADSLRDLQSRVIVLPLPDPNKPFLPVGDASHAGGDPFADSTSNGSARRFGRGALAELFASEAAAPSAHPPGESQQGADQDDPFGDDPFDSDSASAAPADRSSAPDEGGSEIAEPESPSGDEDLSDDPFADF